MANIAGSYDEAAEPGQYDRVPAGTYRAKIIESEIVDISETKASGRCLKLTWQFETGALDGRLFWQRLNMWFSGPEKTPGKVAEIANQQFAAVREATGKIAPQDSAELHHIPCMITIEPQKNNPQYDEVKAIKAVSGAGASSAPLAPQQRSASPVSAQSRSSGSAPWRQSA